jgi:hypothetical protein
MAAITAVLAIEVADQYSREVAGLFGRVNAAITEAIKR